MKLKKVKFSDHLRQAIDNSGISRYRICQLIGLDKAVLSRFMASRSGLSVKTLDRLGELLELKVVAGVKAKPSKKTGRK